MNIVIFCSNPVNGGTARIFYELVTSMRRILEPEHKLTACINKCNPVEIYKKLEGIVRLPVYSEAEVCKGMYGGSTGRRMINFIRRKVLFAGCKRRNIIQMQHYLEKANADAVIIHNGGYVGDDLCSQMLTAAYLCRRKIKSRVLVLHNDMEKGLLSKIRFWAYDKKISKEASSIVTVSNYTRERIRKSSFISRDIVVIYNGISDNCTAERKDGRVACPDTKRFHILMIGNFMDNKGQYEFIRAAGILARTHKDFHFTIIGNVYDEMYYKKCMELVGRLKMEQCLSVYHGVNNASAYISRFNVLAVPSIYDESFGLISVEAMAAGCPVVAFACGGIPEVVTHRKEGFIVPVGDSRQMAARIKWLSEHKDQCEAMGKKGRQSYENKYSVDVMALKYIGLLGIKVQGGVSHE